MIRVLQVVNIMDRAGLETMLMNYYRNIDRNKIQFDFLTHRSEKGAYDDEIFKLGGKVYHAPRLYPKNYSKYFKFMQDFFSQHPEYKIVHSHIDTMSTFPLYTAKKSDIPIRIAHSHSSKLDIDIKLPIKFLSKLFIPYFANKYFACGKIAGEFLHKNRNFKIINNAIDLEKFKFDKKLRKLVRDKLNIKDELVIGHVGRYCYVKNQSFLIDVFNEVLKINPNSRLILIGKGPDEEMLRSKVNNLGLNNKVQFLIDRSDVNELYQAMDIFVMPSLFEGVPVVSIEAQANGLPCIISDKVSNEVLLTNNVETIQLNANISEWAKTICSVKKGRNQNCCKELTEKGYNIEFESIKLQEIYYDMLEREISDVINYSNYTNLQ
ncbi:glycosyltransferase family 1 protein [Clostridium perfringens]